MNEEGFVMITNFQWNTDSYFKWIYQGKELKKEYDRPISSVVKLTDNTGFAIVLSEIDYGS